MGRIVKGARVSSSVRIGLPQVSVSELVQHSDVSSVDLFEHDLFTDEFDHSPVVETPSLPDRAAIVAEIETLIRESASDARTLLDRARTDAMAMIEMAQERVATIEAEAKAAGQAQGEQDGRTSVDAEMADMLATMRGLVEMAREERHKIISGAEHEIVRLAAAIAERVIHRSIGADESIVLDTVRAAIARITSRERVVVRMNPADIDIIRDHRERVTAGADIEHLKIVEDQRVDRGGVIVETESGTIDGRIATQIRETHRLLDIDEPIEVRESPEAAVLASPAKAG